MVMAILLLMKMAISYQLIFNSSIMILLNINMNGTYNLIPKMTKIYIILLMSFLGIFNNLHAAIIDEAQIPYALSISGTDAVRIVLQSTGELPTD